MARGSLPFLVALVTIALPLCSAVFSDKLTVGFYNDKCPQVEKIVSDIVKLRVQDNRGFIPGIIRLFFHDCFISGCDASLLLMPEKYNNRDTETENNANTISLRGLEVLEEIKQELEVQCPGVVSCSDIMAYAARDVVAIAGNPSYVVPAGRRDTTTVTNNEIANGLPLGNASVPTLVSLFEQKGLTREDLVVLEAAHSVGRTRCILTIADPDAFNSVPGSEQIVNRQFQKMVKSKYCNDVVDNFWNITVPLNPEKGDSEWGTSFYRNIMAGKSVVISDLGIAVDHSTRPLVEKYAKDSALWMNKFNEAMIKLGKLNVLTGQEGEIRRSCKFINEINEPVEHKFEKVKHA